jgi:tetratricopeptide (TPR) repeat protein/ubiquinone/menaquinone biosynthesis C-methylase UbiE
MIMHSITAKGKIRFTCSGSLKDDSLLTSELLEKAVTHHKAGFLQKAEVIYLSILQTQPHHPAALHLLGVTAHQQGKNKVARILLEKAIKNSPKEPNFYNNCGEVLRALHKGDLAVDRYKQSFSINPHSAEIHYNLGLALYELCYLEEAITCYKQALSISPNFAEAHNNLGVALQELGNEDAAANSYEQALISNPYLAEAHNNLGLILKASGKPVEAIVHHQMCLRLKPKELIYRIAFTECLSNLQITQATDDLKEDIITTFSLQGINHHDLAFVAASIIKNSHDFQKLAAFIESSSDEITFQKLLTAGLSKVYSEPLLLALLKKAIIRDRSIELVFTKIRRSLLSTAIEIGFTRQSNFELIAFVYALAHQCFVNEYVYAVSETETFQIKKIATLVASFGTENIDDDKKLLIAILACYVPLYTVNQNGMFADLLKKSTHNEIADLITQQIVEPNGEKELRSKLETIGCINNEISQKVRNQYEENPYPRWLSIHQLRGESTLRIIKRLFPHIARKQICDKQYSNILVAGCGAGQQVISNSFKFQSSKILGVDISLSSLSYAKRKAKELKITNVEFKQGDILNLHLLDKTFDLIECIGVLHHLSDPTEGWRVLANLLKPGGLMRIGLYSEIARKDIVAAQSFVRKKGYAANSAGIRQCRQDIFEMPNNSTIGNMTKITDFYTLSETRDLLFHVQEKRFSLLQIAEIIDKLKLTFIGFELDNSLEQKKYLDYFPDDPTATSLYNWHKYELKNKNTFVGLYLFWVQKCT